MSKIALSPNASGTGTLTIAAPDTNTDRTLTLPDSTSTLATTAYVDSSVAAVVTGPTLGTAVASTSGTAIDFTGIPSTAKRVTVMLSGVSTNGTSVKQIQLGSTTFQTTGYSGGLGVIASTTVAGQALTSGMGIYSTAASDVFSGTATIANVSGNSWVMSFSGGGASANFALTSGASVTLAGVLDRIRVTTVTGTDTFDAGTINISWE